MPNATKYREAAQGTAPDPKERWFARIRQTDPEVQDALDRAVELIIEAANASANERGHDAPNAWGVLNEVAWSDREHYALLHIASARARQDTRLWGVEDPEVESYCAYCRSAQPIEGFEGSRCATCQKEGRTKNKAKGPHRSSQERLALGFERCASCSAVKDPNEFSDGHATCDGCREKEKS